MTMSGKKTFLLRVSPTLLKELKAWAAQELRSLNAQIEFILRDAVKKRRGTKEEASSSDETDGNQSKT